jgi:hypothetical protein
VSSLCHASPAGTGLWVLAVTMVWLHTNRNEYYLELKISRITFQLLQCCLLWSCFFWPDSHSWYVRGLSYLRGFDFFHLRKSTCLSRWYQPWSTLRNPYPPMYAIKCTSPLTPITLSHGVDLFIFIEMDTSRSKAWQFRSERHQMYYIAWKSFTNIDVFSSEIECAQHYTDICNGYTLTEDRSLSNLVGHRLSSLFDSFWIDVIIGH